jgi:hypothetical protein
MPIPTQVNPGEVITSDLMNAILAQLATLGGPPAGSQAVPNVFGFFLADAIAAIQSPSRQLRLGFVLDSNGAAIDALASANQNLIVLNQSPAGGSRTDANASVSLVVSGSSSTSSTPVPDPTVSGTQTAGGVVGNSFPAGGTLVIVGTNFSATASRNSVTFNGVPAASVVPLPSDPTRRLQVVIPPGIPGAPTAPGNPPLANVSVVVRVSGSSAAPTASITIVAPAPAQHTIGAVSPGTQFEGQPITITGTNFTAVAQVFIRDVLATSTFNGPTSLSASVPNFPDVQTNALVAAPVRVEIAGNASTVFNGFNVRGV